LDHAYEDYCRCRDAGEPIDPEAFCARFPRYRSSLRRLIDLDQFVGGHAASALAGPAAARPGEIPWPHPGQHFGDFTLLRELGRGSFARVYLATEAPTGDRPVAVKLSREDGGEARTQGRLTHDNIVGVHSARSDPATGLLVVCMPFLGSATLHDVLDHAYPQPTSAPPHRASVIRQAVARAARPADPPAEPRPPGPDLDRCAYVEGVARLALPIAEALAFLHARGIIHRDLKPSNVLLTPGGRPLLLDFNLAAHPDNAAARPGGTPGYMAPEQLHAGAATNRPPIDGRADLFSLGVILYELLTGHHPFGSVPAGVPPEELGPLFLQRQRAGFRPIRALNPQVDRAFARLIERCLAVDPAQRPTGAAEMAEALRRRARAPRRLAVAATLAVLALAAALAGRPFAAPRHDPGESLSAPDWMQKGSAAFAAGDLDGAERCFKQAVEAEPAAWEGHYQLGRVHLLHGRRAAAGGRKSDASAQLEQAEQSFSRAITVTEVSKTVPGVWQGHYGLGRVHLLRGDLPLAERHFSTASRRFRARQRFLLAGCIIGLGAGPASGGTFRALALADPVKVLPTLPGHGPSLACLAYCAGRGGNHALATGQAGQAVTAGFSTPEFFNNQGYSHLRQFQLPEARRAFDTALGKDPSLEPAYLHRATLALLEHQNAVNAGAPNLALPSQALEDVERYLALLHNRNARPPAHAYGLAVKLYAHACEAPNQSAARRDKLVKRAGALFDRACAEDAAAANLLAVDPCKRVLRGRAVPLKPGAKREPASGPAAGPILLDPISVARE
jgi:serine/threonine protein kinase/Tfp pilus assembly protein PilF